MRSGVSAREIARRVTVWIVVLVSVGIVGCFTGSGVPFLAVVGEDGKTGLTDSPETTSSGLTKISSGRSSRSG
jgi:hypothetical protein